MRVLRELVWRENGEDTVLVVVTDVGCFYSPEAMEEFTDPEGEGIVEHAQRTRKSWPKSLPSRHDAVVKRACKTFEREKAKRAKRG
jgi:hypothetical protein